MRGALFGQHRRRWVLLIGRPLLRRRWRRQIVGVTRMPRRRRRRRLPRSISRPFLLRRRRRRRRPTRTARGRRRWWQIVGDQGWRRTVAGGRRRHGVVRSRLRWGWRGGGAICTPRGRWGHAMRGRGRRRTTSAALVRILGWRRFKAPSRARRLGVAVALVDPSPRGCDADGLGWRRGAAGSKRESWSCSPRSVHGLFQLLQM